MRSEHPTAIELPDVLYRFDKNRTEEVRAYVSDFKGKQIAHLRAWTVNDAGETIPTRKGIAVRVELLPELRAAIDALIEAQA